MGQFYHGSEKASVYREDDLHGKKRGFAPRENRCKDSVETCFEAKIQKCKSENNLAGKRVWLPLVSSVLTEGDQGKTRRMEGVAGTWPAGQLVVGSA
jgi:hypothetical protein